MLPQIRQPLTAGCCHAAKRPARAARRRGIAATILALGIWALVPKCPLCLAAHVALWTGLGLSLAQATMLRWSLLVFSGAVLAYFAGKFGGKLLGLGRRFRQRGSVTPVLPRWQCQANRSPLGDAG